MTLHTEFERVDLGYYCDDWRCASWHSRVMLRCLTCGEEIKLGQEVHHTLGIKITSADPFREKDDRNPTA